MDTLAEALVKAAAKCTELDEAAREKGNNYDDSVKVELPGCECPSMDQLGEACAISKCSAMTTGKMK